MKRPTPRRRRRRSQSEIVAQRTMIEIKQQKLAFLRKVSAVLSDALGFTVKVSLARPDPTAGLSPGQRQASRMTRKQAHAQIREAFAPFTSEQS